ncbi:MAG: hypothetical protein R2879_22105 [Saprospiraceae bacterium]
MKKNAVYLLFFTLFSVGCGPKECSHLFPDDSGFYFTIVDSSGKSVIAAYGAFYNKEDIQFVSEEGEIPNNYSLLGDGSFSFIIHDFPSIASDTFFEKNFYLGFPYSLNSSNVDIDTLKFTYFLIENECPEVWFKEFSVFYNDSLYHSGQYSEYFEFLKS